MKKLNKAAQAEALEKIAEEIRSDKVAKRNTIGVAVPGEGNPNADIVFVGEAPGRKEAESGRPFVGPAGKLLRAGLAEINLDADDVFITSACKYFPKHVTPTPKEIAYQKKYLERQLEIINPKVIVIMGRVAALSVLGINAKMVQDHGKVVIKEGRSYFLMLHPAASLHQPRLRSEFLADFKGLQKLLKKPKF